jgi:peptidoglycan/xylan/chitin deacetylase (PgdA/CDA1 family)
MADLKIPILLYHHVHPAAELQAHPPLHPDSYLTPAELEAHCDLLAKNGCSTLTLAEALWLYRRNPREVPRRAVVLTFDDGCRCFSDYALPVLARHGMKSTLFVVAEALGGTNAWDRGSGERDEILLSATALRSLPERSVEIGSHGAAHRDLALEETEVERETAASKALLEAELGREILTFAYAYGHVSPAAREAAAAAGYLGAVSILDQPGSGGDDLFALPRLPVRPGESDFEMWLKIKGLYPLYHRLPRVGLLQSLRRKEAKVAP